METTEIIAELRKAVAMGDSPVFCGASYIPKRVAMEAADRLEELNVWANEWEPVVHAHWIEDDPCCRRSCSACGFVVDDDASNFLYGNYQRKAKRCPECGAHMDETLEIRTAYCPLCDKHFSVRSNDSMGSCPDCGHHVVLHREGDDDV